MNNSSQQDRKIGNSQLIGIQAADRLSRTNYKAYDNESNQLYEREKKNLEEQSDQLPHPAKFDISYLDKFIEEINSSSKQTHEFRSIVKEYKMATSKFSKSAENEFLTNLKGEKKNQVFRDISRIFDQKEDAQKLKDKIRKIMTYKLEDARRNLRDSKWNLTMNLLQMVMNKNRANRDIFDLLQKKVLPMDLRMLIWKIALENLQQSNAYSKKLNQSRLLTISKLDVQIIKDTEIMITQMTIPDSFDGTMIFAMKTILSYYEIKKDRILTDYLYLIAIPLVYTFGEARHLLKIPIELVGYFFTLQEIVTFFDPYVDLVVKHDEAYDAQMVDLFMNCLKILDEVNQSLCDKMNLVLNLSQPTQRTLLVLVIKRFVHSLGFAFLPMDITLFVWDQIIMKCLKNRLEIFVIMAISFFCLKEDIYQCENWDSIVDIYYQKAKQIQMEMFKEYYLDVFKNVKFYLSPYNVDPVLVNRKAEYAADPLAAIIDEQRDKDVEAYKKKWFEGKEYYDQSQCQIRDHDEILPKDKGSAIQQMKMEDALKNIDQQKSQKQAKKLGMVPVEDDDDDDQDILDGL